MNLGQRHLAWRVLGSLGLVLAALLPLLSGPQAASAAGGYNISNMSSTTGQALGIDPAGTAVCTVWTQYDVGSPQVYFRLYNISLQAWNPPLDAAPFQVSTGGNAGKMRCTVDSNGNAHVVWQEKHDGVDQVFHRYRMPNGNWSNIAYLTDGSKPDVDADSSGRVWIVIRHWGGDGGSSTLDFRAWTQAGGWVGIKNYDTGGDGDDARLGVDNNGYAHAVFKNGNTGGGISYIRVKDDGSTGQRISVPNGGSGAVQPDIAVDRGNGTVHVVYSKDWTHVYYARKGFNEADFAFFTEAANGSTAVDNTTIAWSPGNQLFVVFNNNQGSYVAGIKSQDNGQNWTAITPVTNPGGKVANPSVVADANGGSYAVYNNSWDNASVYFAFTPGFIPEAERCAGFADMQIGTPACPAVTELTRMGVIKGYATTPPTFGPGVTVKRAEVAAFVVRALQWGTRPTDPNTFTDFGSLDAELRNASLVLANACTDTSDVSTCVARGYGDGRFGPNDPVTYAQVMSFITRAFVFNGSWQPDPNGPQYYTGVPADHVVDVLTYNSKVGQITEVPMPSGAGWNQGAPRAWVAYMIFKALQTIP